MVNLSTDTLPVISFFPVRRILNLHIWGKLLEQAVKIPDMLSIMLEQTNTEVKYQKRSQTSFEILAGEWIIIYNECVRNVCTSLLAAKG